MPIARKSTSRITVAETSYRWVVAGNDGFLDLIIEHADKRGQRLCVQFDYSFGEMTPRHVRTVIIAALAKGWTPEQCNTQLEFRLVDNELVSMQEIRDHVSRKQ